MDAKERIKRIEKYLAGQCSEEEKIEIEQWYEAFGQQERLFFDGDVEKMKNSAERSLKVIQAKAMQNREGQLERQQERQPAKPTSYRTRHFPLWMAAACVLLSLSLVIWLYLKSVQAPEKYTVLSAGIGEVKHWKLADGSSVWLNAGSTMKLPADFNESHREIFLEGEAFFDVAKQFDKPFIIHTAKLDTRVLGTAFSISAYPHATLNTVTVATGKVQVKNASRILGNLTTDKKIEYRNSSGEYIVLDTDASKDVAWKEQQLVFTNLPMYDIGLHLQRWYGYRFNFKNQQLKQVRFTASFKNTITLPDLLKIMKEVSHVNYDIDLKARTVTFL
ncbi:FecR family protein [Olivibacter jilunii]|uniref:FecR family protein n=1 Tax=Olivibacter jilunii TaxID=985016 RepID=UPI003F1355E1